MLRCRATQCLLFQRRRATVATCEHEELVPASRERAGISSEDLDRLAAVIRSEFPADEMMAELHILRTVLSVEHGDITLNEILQPRAAA